jgi:hypothetical protein
VDEGVCNESDELAHAASGPHALRRGGATGIEVGEGAELGADDGAGGLCTLGVERLVD